VKKEGVLVFGEVLKSTMGLGESGKAESGTPDKEHEFWQAED
jgi:hypothetical protein